MYLSLIRGVSPLEEQLLVRVRLGSVLRKQAALVGAGGGRFLLLAVEIEVVVCLLRRLRRLLVVVRRLLWMPEIVQPLQCLVDGT